MHNKQGHQIIKGSSSIEPTSSPLEAKPVALLMEVQQARNLGYYEVTFVGDGKA